MLCTPLSIWYMLIAIPSTVTARYHLKTPPTFYTTRDNNEGHNELCPANSNSLAIALLMLLSWLAYPTHQSINSIGTCLFLVFTTYAGGPVHILISLETILSTCNNSGLKAPENL